MMKHEKVLIYVLLISSVHTSQIVPVWNKDLATLTENYDVKIEAGSTTKVVITIGEPIENREFVLRELLDYVSNRPETHWIEPQGPVVTANKYSRKVVLAQSTTGQLPPPPLSSLLENILLGDNMIIGCADTGIDMYHCYFRYFIFSSVFFLLTLQQNRDDTLPFEFGVLNYNQRKVVLYEPYADDKELAEGHGTHVV
jgi:hypothetical protein